MTVASSKLTRRDFLKLSGAASLGLALSACGIAPTPTSAPTNTLLSTHVLQPTATSTSTPTVTPSPTATPFPNTLRTYADLLGIEIGGSTAIDYMQDWHPEHTKFRPIMAENFNLFGSAWDTTWTNPYSPLRPRNHQFHFDQVDKLVAFAKKYNMRIQALHLVWGNKQDIPEWLRTGNFSRNELLEILEEHISTVVGRYRGLIHEWSVVNELFGLWWEPGNRFWYDRLGPDLNWVSNCFKWARQADPNAKLFLNDFGIEFKGYKMYSEDRDRQIFALLRKMKSDGVPVDGVGFQMHLYGVDFLTDDDLLRKMDALRENIEKYQSLGLEVLFTEIDVRLCGVPGSMEQKYGLQARIYQKLFETGLDAGVRSFCIFNVVDKLSWLVTPENNSPWNCPDADPVIFDREYNPKPAYTAILDVLKRRATMSNQKP